MEPSIRFPTLVKHLGSEATRNEELRTLDLPLENNLKSSKLETQNLSAETHDSNPGVMLHNQLIPLLSARLNFGNTVSIAVSLIIQQTTRR